MQQKVGAYVCRMIPYQHKQAVMKIHLIWRQVAIVQQPKHLLQPPDVIIVLLERIF